MPPRGIKIGVMTVMIVWVAVAVSVSAPSASRESVACQEQEVLTTPPALKHVADLSAVVTYLLSHLHRMQCVTQQIMAETTLARQDVPGTEAQRDGRDL